MRFKLIACKSMTRELSYLVSKNTNIVDITWMRQGLHDTPQLLNKALCEEIEAVENGTDVHTNIIAGQSPNPRSGISGEFDAILLGYGLCSNGIEGLTSRKYPLIIPRGHDCITFLLGSRERYNKYFSEIPGCFWYTASWIENCSMPCKEVHEGERQFYREQGYDEEELDYLMESMQGWTKSYRFAAYVEMPFYDNPVYREFTKDAADYFGWNYRNIKGDISLLEKFIAGEWNEKDFLYVSPGYRVFATNDDRIIDCKKVQ